MAPRLLSSRLRAPGTSTPVAGDGVFERSAFRPGGRHVLCPAANQGKELNQRLASAGHRFSWSHIKQDLEALNRVVIEENGKRFAIRSECKGNCGRILQAVGVALPPRSAPWNNRLKFRMVVPRAFLHSIEYRNNYEIKIAVFKTSQVYGIVNTCQEGLICDEALVRKLEAALQKEKIPAVNIYSGAGHDALAMAALCPVAMLFVRCKDGLSHHPDETVDINDAIVAKRILKRFLRDFL